MKHTACILSILSILLFCSFSEQKGGKCDMEAEAHVYQYSVPTINEGDAYLWIPPSCKYVRGIILACRNMLEQNWVESPIVRKAAADENLAILYLYKKSDDILTWEMKEPSIKLLEQITSDLARESGYQEIAWAPFILTGHSWMGRIPWTYTSHNPGRVAMSIPIRTYPLPDTLNYSNIPMCYIVGQTTELPQYNDGRPGDRDFYWPVVRETAIALRAKNENNLIGVVTYPGGLHTDWNDNQSEFLALVIRKTSQYRIPKGPQKKGKVKLIPVKKEQGWLTDCGGMEPDKFEPAPYKQYKGDPRNAYWFFDEEQARATVKFNGDRKVRKMQMPTFVENGKVVPVGRDGYVKLALNPEEDGRTFSVQGSFLNEVPEGLVDAGKLIGHAKSGEFSYRASVLNGVQIGPDKFRIATTRYGSGTAMINVYHPGDDEYRCAIQPSKVMIPMKNTNGISQKINFPKMNDITEDVRTIQLQATVDSPQKPEYYVKAGPAIIVCDSILKITSIPPKSKFPVKITVVACQWGRTIDPLYQTAREVKQTFYIQKKK
jgi:hypothetical protein